MIEFLHPSLIYDLKTAECRERFLILQVVCNTIKHFLKDITIETTLDSRDDSIVGI